MKDPLKLIQALREVLRLIFGDAAPPWILRLVGIVLAVGFVLLGIWGSLYVIDKIRQLLSASFWPLFYKTEKKRRTARRRRFADHIESEMRRLNSLEQWSDYRFAELEAEVEAEGRRQIPLVHFFLHGVRNTLRREKSLSQALGRSKERLILVEGEPGAGKSVALRHVVQQMARQAMRSKNVSSIIPVYINLRELERSDGDSIDNRLIREFVTETLNRFNDRDIEEFLDQEFDEGLRNGTWLFLFDSFDEIPEILSSVGADRPIREYAQAIADFLGGMNQCRGIVASRQFRGPGQLGWPRFRILTLSESRQKELISRADLPRESESQFFVNLLGAPDEIRAMASNPMFLGLLCEQSRTGHLFPHSAHTVFETYLETRLTRDADRLDRRFKLQPEQLREAAESIAFCMASDAGLGLSPSRVDLKASLTKQGFEYKGDPDIPMDALEFIKLARQGTAETGAASRTFTFAHRRFQEYFATCVVLDNFGRVSPQELLTNGRWRETAVVLCQTQSLDRLAPIIHEAAKFLSNIAAAIPPLPKKIIKAAPDHAPMRRQRGAPSIVRTPFPWPSGALHILGILQEGFGTRLRELPEGLQSDASRLVLTASLTGLLFDRKWALEVGGSVRPSLLLELLRTGFSTSSQWLRDVAYRQTARLAELPKDISDCLCDTLVQMAAQGKLSREWLATKAHLSRLEKNQNLLSVAILLRWLRPVDFALHAVYAVSLANIYRHQPWVGSFHLLLLLISLSLLFFQPRRLIYEIARRGLIAEAISSTDVLMTIMLRTGLLITPLKYLSPNLHSKRAYAASILLLYVYAATWAPLSILAAKFGEFTRPIWWPLMPFWPVLYVSRDTKTRLAELLGKLKQHKLLIAIELAGICTAWILVFLSHKYRLLRWILAASFGVASLASIVWPTATYCRLLLSDWIRWHKWKKHTFQMIDANQLAETLSSLQTIRFKVHFLEAVYLQGSLLSSPKVESGLTEQLTKLHQGKDHKIDYPVVEALSKLLEQLHARARG
jgi:hypothetical protein